MYIILYFFNNYRKCRNNSPPSLRCKQKFSWGGVISKMDFTNKKSSKYIVYEVIRSKYILYK